MNRHLSRAMERLDKKHQDDLEKGLKQMNRNSVIALIVVWTIWFIGFGVAYLCR